MIDERALQAALVAYLASGGPEHVDMMRAATEACEAARWRPIEEAARSGDWILVHKDSRMSGSFDLMFWDETFEWCVAGGDRTYTHSDLVGRGAMFRTIDPPRQNAVSRATSTPPAAEEA